MEIETTDNYPDQPPPTPTKTVSFSDRVTEFHPTVDDDIDDSTDEISSEVDGTIDDSQQEQVDLDEANSVEDSNDKVDDYIKELSAGDNDVVDILADEEEIVDSSVNREDDYDDELFLPVHDDDIEEPVDHVLELMKGDEEEKVNDEEDVEAEEIPIDESSNVINQDEEKVNVVDSTEELDEVNYPIEEQQEQDEEAEPDVESDQLLDNDSVGDVNLDDVTDDDQSDVAIAEDKESNDQKLDQLEEAQAKDEADTDIVEGNSADGVDDILNTSEDEVFEEEQPDVQNDKLEDDFVADVDEEEDDEDHTGENEIVEDKPDVESDALTDVLGDEEEEEDNLVENEIAENKPDVDFDALNDILEDYIADGVKSNIPEEEPLKDDNEPTDVQQDQPEEVQLAVESDDIEDAGRDDDDQSYQSVEMEQDKDDLEAEHTETTDELDAILNMASGVASDNLIAPSSSGQDTIKTEGTIPTGANDEVDVMENNAKESEKEPVSVQTLRKEPVMSEDDLSMDGSDVVEDLGSETAVMETKANETNVEIKPKSKSNLAISPAKNVSSRRILPVKKSSPTNNLRMKPQSSVSRRTLSSPSQKQTKPSSPRNRVSSPRHNAISPRKNISSPSVIKKATRMDVDEVSLNTRARRATPGSVHLRLYEDGLRRIKEKHHLQEQHFDDEVSLNTRARSATLNQAQLRLYSKKINH